MILEGRSLSVRLECLEPHCRLVVVADVDP